MPQILSLLFTVMQHTIFDTPIINSFCRFISWVGLQLAGWKLQGKQPNLRKYVLIAAPHTSNWDFILIIAMAFRYRMKIFWMGKHSLFKGPPGFVMKWLGGIPVERSKSNGLVQEAINHYNQNSDMIVAIPPEGSRSKVSRWRSGFYHVANGAKVPIVLGFLDFKKKVGGFGPTFIPSGNFEDDLIKIKAFYANISGKKPYKFS